MTSAIKSSAPRSAFATSGRVSLLLTVVSVALGIAIAVHAVLSAQRREMRADAAVAAQRVLVVATIKPQSATGSAEVVLPGTLRANYETPIYSRANGYLKRWLVDIGTLVKRGQLLAQIESPEIDSQLRQAEAALAVTQANEKLAHTTAARWRRLGTLGMVAQQGVDEKDGLAAAADAQVQAARADVQRLRELAGFERIVAPYDGVVTARNTDVGHLVSAANDPGRELFRIADTTRLRVYVNVPQSYAAAMIRGLILSVTVPEHPGQVYPAILDTTSGAVEPDTRTLTVQLHLDNPKRELLAGGYAEVHFKLPQGAPGSFIVPANTLLFREGMSVATLDSHGLVAIKRVTLGRDFGAEVEIIQGLARNDDIILNPPDSLTPGTSARQVPPSSAPNLGR